MTVEVKDPRTRRAVLAGGLAGVVALVASALGRPFAAEAANGDTVKVGGVFAGSSATQITSSATGLIGVTTARSGKRAGVLGTAPPGDGRGVMGKGPIGVVGQTGSPTGVGVLGTASAGGAIAILGKNAGGPSDDAIAVKGQSTGFGIHGEGTGTLGTGVFGKGELVGVQGAATSLLGIGVLGAAAGDNGTGVVGEATAGQGIAVKGIASGSTGIAGSFEANGGPGTFALRVLGRAGFSTAGSSNVGSGVDHKDVTPGIELTGNSTVLATLQSDGGVAVAYVEVHTGNDTFTVHFTGTTTASCSVAWFVLG